MPTGLTQVLARISTIHELAGRASGGFSGALTTALVGEAPPATVDLTPSATTSTAATPTSTRTGMDLPSGAARWQASIDRAATAQGVDPKLMTALVWVESGFKPDAVSHAGAIGLAQLMPGTAELLGVDPYDPQQNLAGGARFLREMIDRFGRVDLALAAYNAGPARVAAAHDGGQGVPVSAGYVEAVLDRYRQLGGTP